MNTKLIIPKLCKVGFNVRSDTYTKKLGYVIYHDGKVWRKETSWENWREKEATEKEIQKALDYYKKNYSDKQPQYYKPVDTFDQIPTYARGKFGKGVAPVEFDNIPTEGFVLNRKAGGTSSGWDHRQTYCRVYDPRGFEFEITIPNLLYILENTNSIKGKGLEGKFIYAWDGKDLVLVPQDAPEYKEMIAHTELQDLKISGKDLIEGGVYIHKDGNEKTYLGQSEMYNNHGVPQGKKRWWYYKEKRYSTWYERFGPIETANVKKFVRMDDNYADLMDRLSKESDYKKPSVEYTKLDESSLDRLLNVRRKRYYGSYFEENTLSAYIVVGKKYKSVRVNHTPTSYNDINSYTITIGRKEEEFKTIKELLNKYTLWQIRMTN